MADNVKQCRGVAVAHSRCVSDAIADALRGEITGGRFKAGERLPPVGNLRTRFSAGEFAVRSALHKLRDEGLVSIVKHVGAVVTGKSSRSWKGHVLLIRTSAACSFAPQRFTMHIAAQFEAAGWMAHPLFLKVDQNGCCDVKPIVRHLAGGVAFAVLCTGSKQIPDLMESAGVPYVVVDGYTREFPRARAVIRYATHGGYADLIDYLRKKGVGNLLEVDYERQMDRAFKVQLAGSGITVRRVLCKRERRGELGLGDVREMGHKAVAQFLMDGASRAKLPDAVLFDDDYLAVGGVFALLQAGVRIPEDTLVVTMSNRGNAMLAGVPHSQIEFDPDSMGDCVAKYVLACLDGRKARPKSSEVRFIADGLAPTPERATEKH